MTEWKWMQGMRTRRGAIVVAVEDDGYTTGFIEKKNYVLEITDEERPDWSDPATKGCLLEQVRWRHAAECSTEYRSGRGWRVVYPVGEETKVVVTQWRRTEAGALLAALEEAE